MINILQNIVLLRKTMLDVVALRERARSTFSVLSRTDRTHLRWVTTIIGAYVVGLDDDVSAQICAAVEEYRDQRYHKLRDTGRIRRHTSGQTRWAGAIEIDLLHPRSECSQGKRSLLQDLGVNIDEIQPDQRVILLHEHAVYDCQGHASPKVIMTVLRGAFPGYRRIHAADLHDHRTVSENLTRLSGYSTKCRYEYSDSMNDKATTFSGLRYEPEWRNYITDLYDRMGVDRMISTNVVVQRAHSNPMIECTFLPETAKCINSNLIDFSPENSENDAENSENDDILRDDQNQPDALQLHDTHTSYPSVRSSKSSHLDTQTITHDPPTPAPPRYTPRQFIDMIRQIRERKSLHNHEDT